MLEDTYEVRRNAGLLSDEPLAYAIAEDYVTRDVTAAGKIVDDARIADETRSLLFGNGYSSDVADELNATIQELTRPMELVYELLDDYDEGYTLCTASVRRLVDTADGGSIVVSKQGRFVTSDAAIAAQYRLRPAMLRLERLAERAALQWRRDEDRIPALTAHRPAMISASRRVIDRELPAPSSNGGGS